MERNKNCNTVFERTVPKPSDELLNNEQVKSILKIGKNSLIKLVRDGVLVAIRINDRTVRFSKASIMEYIERKQEGSIANQTVKLLSSELYCCLSIKNFPLSTSPKL